MRARWSGFLGRRRVLARIGLALASLVAADLVAGWFLLEPRRMGFRRPHPYYHHGFVANRSAVAQWGPGALYPVFTNSLACLDSEVRDVPRRPTGRRVVLIGDSFLEGVGLAFPQTCAGILQRELAAQGVEVLNAAVMSFSPHLYELRMRHLIEQEGLELDELCVFVDLSDIQDEVLYRKFTPRQARLGEEALQALESALRQRSLLAWLADDLLHSRDRQRRRAEYDAQFFPPWLDYFWIENQDYEPYSDPQFARVRIDWTTDPLIDNRWTQEGLERARTHMDALAELCRARAIALTVVVYPWPNQVERLERESRQAAIWRAWCAERGADFVDLYPIFIPVMAELARANRARLFIPGDVHWSPAGHRLVASQVEAWLRD